MAKKKTINPAGIESNLQTLPPEGKPNKNKWILAIVIVIIIIAVYQSNHNSSSSSNTDVDKASSGVIIVAEEYIKEHLKSPSTAQFPNMYDEFDQVKAIGNNEFVFNSYVDSQNSFGAMIRTHFSCEVSKDNDDQYIVLSCDFKDNQ